MEKTFLSKLMEKKLEIGIWATLIVMAVIGEILQYNIERQMLFPVIVICFAVAFLCRFINTSRLYKANAVLVGVGVFFLVLQWIANDYLSDRGFFGIGFFNIKIIALITPIIILMLARLASIENDNKKNLIKLWSFGMVSTVVCWLLLDVNSLTWVIPVITFAMSMFISDRKRVHKYSLCGFVGGLAIFFRCVAVGYIQWGSVLGYRIDRILGWLNPSEYRYEYGYVIYDCVEKIKNSTLLGNGFSGYEYSLHSDCFVAILADTMGWLMVVLLLIVVVAFLFCIYGVYKKAKSCKRNYESLLVLGILIHLSCIILYNFAMNFGFVPYVMSLNPFVSVSLSQSIFAFAEVGIVLAVLRRIKRLEGIREIEIEVSPIKELFPVFYENQSVAVVFCSVNDIDEARLNGFEYTLHLSFEDTLESDKSTCFTMAMAGQIRDFIEKAEKAGVEKIIFACDSGQSRSTALAAAYSRKSGRDEYVYWNDCFMHPNTLVYDRMTYMFEVPVSKLGLRYRKYVNDNALSGTIKESRRKRK